MLREYLKGVLECFNTLRVAKCTKCHHEIVTLEDGCSCAWCKEGTMKFFN